MTTRHAAFVSAFALSLAAPAAAQQAFCEDCAVERFAECGGFLEGATFAPDGGFWVVDMDGNRVIEVDDAGQCTTAGEAAGRPNGARFGADGRLVIADADGLNLFDTASGSLTPLTGTSDDGPLSDLNDLAFMDDGGIIFTAPNMTDLQDPQGRVFYLAPGASEARLIADGLNFPNGVEVLPGGEEILVGEFGAKRILAYPAPGPDDAGEATPEARVFAETEGGIGPDGMTLDDRGRLFAANFQAGEVRVFDTDGAYLGAIKLPERAGSFTTNVAVKDGYLYITEAQQGVVWRVALGGN